MRTGTRVGAVAAVLASACNPTQGSPPVPVSASAPPVAAPPPVLSASPTVVADAGAVFVTQMFGTLAVGHASGYAIASSSCIYGWGKNAGDGTTEPRTTPVLVTGATGVRAVSAGGGSACALMGDGTVRCWGDNDRGQLGDGTHKDRASPVTVGAIVGAVEIAVGGKHACARLGDGTVRCWGDDANGELGDGAPTHAPHSTPVAMAGVTAATRVAAGFDTTCVVVTGGRVLCAGGNGRATPMAGLDGIVDVALGAHVGCARSREGEVLCWGDASEGALGRHPGARGAPALVAGVSHAVRIAVGGQMACAVDDVGRLRCWGHDIGGALASRADCVPSGPSGTACDTSDGAQPDPTPIGFLGPVVDVAVAMNHACARAADGAVTCWGMNVTGALGIGTSQTVRGKPPTLPLPTPCRP